MASYTELEYCDLPIFKLDINSYYGGIMENFELPALNFKEDTLFLYTSYPEDISKYYIFKEIFVIALNNGNSSLNLNFSCILHKYKKMENILIGNDYLDVLKKICDIKYCEIKTYYIPKSNELQGLIKKMNNYKFELQNKRDIRLMKQMTNRVYGGLSGLQETTIKNVSNIEKPEIDLDKFDHTLAEKRSTISGLFVAQVGQKLLIEKILEVHELGGQILQAHTDCLIFGLSEDYVHKIFDIGENIGQGKKECGKLTNYYGDPTKYYKFVIGNKSNPEKTKEFRNSIIGQPKSILKTLSLDCLKLIFNPKFNVIFSDAKIVSYFNYRNQMVLTNATFESNANIKPTHKFDGKTNKILSTCL